MTGYKTYIAAAIAYLGALLCVLEHLNTGDLAHNWTTCLALVSGGTAAVGFRHLGGRILDALQRKP